MEDEKEECLCCVGRIFRTINDYIAMESRLQIEIGTALQAAHLRREERK